MVLDSIYDAEKSLFERLDPKNQPRLPAALEEILVGYIPTLFTPTDRVEQTRIKAAEASIGIARLARKSKRVSFALTSAMADARREERSDSVLQNLERAKMVLDK